MKKLFLLLWLSQASVAAIEGKNEKPSLSSFLYPNTEVAMNSTARDEAPQFLPVEKAFQLSYQADDSGGISLSWEIAPDYYLYRHRFKFVAQEKGVTLGEPELPEGKVKEDEFFGKQQVYYHQLATKLPVLAAEGEWVKLKVSYQGCAEAGLCYPPQNKIIKVKYHPASLNRALALSANKNALVVNVDPPRLSETEQYSAVIEDSSLLSTLIFFFSLGLGLAFTPCVFPMVPILSSIIVGQGSSVSVSKGFILSLVYVLAIAFTYAGIGAAVGHFGASFNLQATFQVPWVIIVFSLFFVLLALSMFGLIKLQLPSVLQNYLTRVSNKQKGGTYAGVAVMGVLSTLIVSPCVTAPLIGALGYISTSGDWLLGASALFVMGMGMGVPLMVLGASGGKLLPKVGHWMDRVSIVFGVGILGLAIWMLERVLAGPFTLALWGLLLVVSAIYMKALEPVPAGGFNKLSKGLGVALLIYGGLLFIGVATNGQDPLRPLQNFTLANRSDTLTNPVVPFVAINSLADLNQEIVRASQQDQALMLDFYADWCVSCKLMERDVFPHPEVMQALANVRLLRADVTANNPQHKALLKQFGIYGPPAILFFDAQGNEVSAARLFGEKTVQQFLAHLSWAFQPTNKLALGPYQDKIRQKVAICSKLS